MTNTKEYQRQYRATHKKQAKQYNQMWYSKNKEWAIQYRKKNKDKYNKMARGYNLIRKYGITTDQRNQMCVSQNGECAICHNKFRDGDNSDMNVDHNHTTGKVRQLLCRKCNWGLGMFDENRDTLLKAIEYLNKWNDNANN